MKFYLGVPEPSWTDRPEFKGVPTFVSFARMERLINKFPEPKGPVAWDSSGFSMLQKNGRWTFSASEYAAKALHYAGAMGLPDWIAPQDWMCEELVINGGTKNGIKFVGTRRFLDPLGVHTLDEMVLLHQRLTVLNGVALRRMAPELPFRFVLQGNTKEQYFRHIDMYLAAGVDLWSEELVGLGSVCRRQNTDEIVEIVTGLYELGLRLHGFGVKTQGIERYGHMLVSADSMAWSFDARMAGRKGRKLCNAVHPRGGKDCASCPVWALMWREKLMNRISRLDLAA